MDTQLDKAISEQIRLLMLSLEDPRDRYSLQKLHYNYSHVIRDCEMNRYGELLREMFQSINHVEINKRYDNLRFFYMCEMWNKLKKISDFHAKLKCTCQSERK